MTSRAVQAATTEAETRSLAGLPVNASIEEIEKDKPTKLANAAQTTEIPGVDLKARQSYQPMLIR